MFDWLTPEKETIIQDGVDSMRLTDPAQLPMRSALRTEWLKRLRSGQYQQMQGYLHRHDVFGNPSYCCLGVMCDISTVTMSEVRWATAVEKMNYPATTTEMIIGVGDGLRSSIPPNSVVKYWIPNTPRTKTDDFMALLSYCNDRELTFSEIADLIEFHTVPVDV